MHGVCPTVFAASSMRGLCQLCVFVQRPVLGLMACSAVESHTASRLLLGPVHGTVGLKGHGVPTKWVALARAISTYMHRSYTCNTVSVTSKHDILKFWLP